VFKNGGGWIYMLFWLFIFVGVPILAFIGGLCHNTLKSVKIRFGWIGGISAILGIILIISAGYNDIIGWIGVALFILSIVLLVLGICQNSTDSDSSYTKSKSTNKINYSEPYYNSKYITDEYNNTIRRIDKIGDNKVIYDERGEYSGRTAKYGNTEIIYDSKGNYKGRV
jgi:hypothetical protein